MRKECFYFFALVVLFFGCKKNDDELSNYWATGYIKQKAAVGSVDGTITHSSSITTVKGNILKGVSNKDSIVYLFKGLMTPGSYKVVGGSPDSTEVTFYITGENDAGIYAFSATGKDVVNVIVKEANNKLMLSMPKAWAKNSSGDSVLVWADLVEN
jgi:hypothetical protein